MKKTLILTLALGLAGASSLMAGSSVDVYITGSTAFRGNVYTACQKLFVGGNPNVYYGSAANGGADSGWSSTTAAWAMTGTPISSLTQLSGDTLTIHGLFTGSISGLKTTEQSTKLTFPAASGTAGGLCNAYVTNSPTIGFSDSDGAACPYPATGNFVQESVAVQPFVFAKSVATVGAVTNINNVSWEQLNAGIPNGYIPLAAWTGKVTDTNIWVYLLQRTKDSGTRRTETAGEYYQFNDTVGIWILDYTNYATVGWYQPSTLAATLYASSPNGVVGSTGLNGANLNWGYGFVAGGDIKNALNLNNFTNQAIAMLSMSDSKGVGTGGTIAWNNVISYNGLWPTAAGAGIRGNTTVSNDYSPITLGYYPLWGVEVLVHPINPGLIADQNISKAQLGDWLTAGTFMGVFNAQTVNNGGSPVAGSIENEIALSEPSGGPGFPATAIRLSEMLNSRSAVGGQISPPFLHP